MHFKSEFKFIVMESWCIFKLALPIYWTTIISELINSIIPLVFAGHFGNVRTNYAAVMLSINFIIFTGRGAELLINYTRGRGAHN